MGYVSLKRKGVIEKCDTSMKLCEQKRERRLPRLPFLFLVEPKHGAKPIPVDPGPTCHHMAQQKFNGTTG
jgi:hypothetical protein